MKKIMSAVALLVMLAQGPLTAQDGTLRLTSHDLRDRIRGAWAGQVIGCTYGGPTEFRWNSTFIPDYVPISWNENIIEWWYDHAPGLYDDVYMDLTFVQVFEEKGLDASAADLARAFAFAEYPLWHANNMARYNIKNGVLPPDSGHWMNNPHADDIDYQIEADFSGIMAPGLPNVSAEISDRVGHIMNYGDGWYGGVYVGALYSLAFQERDIPRLVERALGVIPQESRYHRAMSDVLRLYRENPDDWKQSWFEIERKWGEDIGCPEGVFKTFNIDAVINSAWVLLGLLYGEGDFEKTLDIATRAGDDSDCNPATAGGILGCMYGYQSIPEKWRRPLQAVEERDFAYTSISLRDASELSYQHALEIIRRHGGEVGERGVSIPVQVPRPVRLEESFPGHYPVQIRSINSAFINEASFEFEGIGFALRGHARTSDGSEKIIPVEVWIDGELDQTTRLSTRYIDRKETSFWRYQLPHRKHEIRLRIPEPREEAIIELTELIIYDKEP